MLFCKFCNKFCKNHNSFRNHERLCPKNSGRKYKNGMTGKSAWNKGLTKDTDDRVKSMSENIQKTMRKKVANGYMPVPAHQDYWTDEKRKEKSIWRKEFHKQFPEMHPNRKLAGNRNKMTYPEKVAFDWLTKNQITFKAQEKVGEYYPDFIINENIIIEIDGERWHDEEQDRKRDNVLKDKGFKVYRINSKEKIEDRLKNILIKERILSE